MNKINWPDQCTLCSYRCECKSISGMGYESICEVFPTITDYENDIKKWEEYEQLISDKENAKRLTDLIANS